MTVNERVVNFRIAQVNDLNSLLNIEQVCFQTDKLSKRSFKRFITHQHCIFLVSEVNDTVVGYALVIFHRGTRLARLYSMAVLPDFRKLGLASELLQKTERLAEKSGALYFRLEVSNTNEKALALYNKLGFKKFALIKDYYQDHTDAIRMQKRIRYLANPSVHNVLPWVQQRTPFTCGPASLMMGVHALHPNYEMTLSEELTIWREATTIYMTSGHGGCHPAGLAIAAFNRGVQPQVWINQNGPLFIDGVRSEDKKEIISNVHHHYIAECEKLNIPIHYDTRSADDFKQACDVGDISLVLISTYRMDRKKAPHWVVVSGYDEQCFYLHDPDPDEDDQDHADCQFIPIRFDDFERMTLFGTNKMRTSLRLSKIASL